MGWLIMEFNSVYDLILVWSQLEWHKPKCYIKETGQEHKGQIYFTERIGLHDGTGNRVEYR